MKPQPAPTRARNRRSSSSELFAQYVDVIANTEFLDLRDPSLY